MEAFKVDESQNSVLLTWRNVSVYVLDLRRKVCKQVVTNVRGAVQPGELTGILGGSGSGKSSLMTALAFRNPIYYLASLTVQGDIRVNGCPVDPQYMRQNSGYMHQDDIFIDTMTVIEHLWFMARMKLDRDIEKSEIESRIKILLASVGLSARRNVTIGNTESNKVLSGGEKKRLAFATELLSDPPILFLDEPTTGQDAHTASILVDQLQSFASRGRTVLCTIHQPSSAVFRSFQKIILVAEGRIAFAGTNEEAIKFFSSLGYVCPHTYNPADFLIGTIVATSSNRRGEVMSIQRICDAFLSSDACKEIDLIIQLQLHIAEFKEHWHAMRRKAKKAPKFYTKLRWLIHRGAVQVIRDPSLQILRILQKLAIALVAGLCFFGAIKLDQLGVQAVQGVIFIMVSENTFFPMYSTLSLIPQEFPLFFREYKAGMYPVHLYYIARITSLLPGLILEPIIFTSIVYWLAGLANTVSAFFTTLGIVLLTMNVSTACGTT
ncbi:hypothetical protein QAD02_022174 [Eretmocerus hayati]|uniref:Uncharacterized protein n=1 Tax=Eretmocerus hayati TaxID=131215 RepID=A0ACC2PRZ0_9HYME|nr:hypothetical protein QAD02_022174 [Eretmocerus hayati]